jgi:hypothetical protein
VARTVPAALASIVLLASCGDNPVSPAFPNPVLAVYDEFQRDTIALPIVISQDAHCTTVNSGGWVSLNADQTFMLSLDNTSTACDTGYVFPTSVHWKGTFTQRDSVVLMTLDGSRGADIAAVFHHPPSYFPWLTFHFAGHDYIVLNHEATATLRAQ